jgi:hypothetical protein
MILIYPIGIPLMYYLLLKQVKHKLDPGQKRLTYELGSDDAGMKEAIRLRNEFEEHDPDVKRLHFLYASYEPSCWWFEVAETLRRLTFTCGMIFFLPGTAVQISASMLLCLGAMRIYAGYKPFVKDSLDLLAEATQWQLFLTMFAALAMKVDTSNESTQDNKLFGIVICILQFAGPVLVPLYSYSRTRTFWEVDPEPDEDEEATTSELHSTVEVVDKEDDDAGLEGSVQAANPAGTGRRGSASRVAGLAERFPNSELAERFPNSELAERSVELTVRNKADKDEFAIL